MKLLTSMLKELTEMTKILQFRCYFKFRTSLHKLMCKNSATMTILSIAVICFKGSEKESGIALYQCHDYICSKKFQSCVQIRMTSFIEKVSIHDKSM